MTRHLGLFAATSILVGGVVGSGIFLVPGEMLRAAGSVPLMMAVWLAAGALSFLGALIFAELGSRFPEAGGEYVYLREAFGQGVAFVYGWTLFAVIQSGSLAAVAVAFGEYAARAWGGGRPGLWAAVLLLAAGLVNMRTARVAVALQASVTVTKCLALGALCLAVFVAPGRDLTALRAGTGDSTPSWSGFGLAMLAALWAYDGWNAVSLVAGEVREPRRNLPRALLGGLGLVVILYLLTSSAYVVCLGPDRVAASRQLAADLGARVLGDPGERLMAALIALSTGGTVLGMMLTCPRTYYAMARDGVFLRAAGTIHPRWGTPHVAVVLQLAWAFLLLALGTFETLLAYVMFSNFFFYGLTAAGLPVVRRAGGSGGFSVPGYPWTPAVFVAACAVLTANSLWADPASSATGLALMVSGLPIYFWTRGRPGTTTGTDP
ncbi:MAG: amino acid permease [Candidatus Riflebacteria bacterium]|nr:amino acid permease [Candidatus Riflebacteria bacterium]